MIFYSRKPIVILGITIAIFSSLPVFAQETTEADEKVKPFAIDLPGGNPTVPPSVRPVTVPSTSDGDFTISWSNVGAQSYEIYMSPNGGSSYGKIQTLGSGYSSYSVNNYGAGTYRFRVTACNSSNRYYCSHTYSNNVTVTLPKYTVSARVDGGGGSVSPATQSIQKGKRTTINVSKSTGYEIHSITGCNGSLSGGTYTTGKITSNCSVTARFKKKTFSATSIIKVENGDISPLARTIEYQKTGKFTLTPDSGYRSSSVIGCPGQLNGNTFTTAPMTASCYLNPQFVKVFNVTTEASAGGRIDPVSRVVDSGMEAEFTIIPDLGYETQSVSGCFGEYSKPVYTTTPVSSACTVKAKFVKKTYDVNTNIGTGGKVRPEHAVVDAGDRLSLTISPDIGYKISEVNGCGVTFNGTAYTTTEMTVDCTVNATFEKIDYEISTIVEGSGGIVSPSQAILNYGEKQTFHIIANSGYRVLSTHGCHGSLHEGNLFETGAITEDCSVTSTFQKTYQVKTNTSVGGSVMPLKRIVDSGGKASLTIVPALGYSILSANGCKGELSGNVFTTSEINSDCLVNVTFKLDTTERRVVFIHTDLQGSVAAESDENGNVH
ncbi:fibronectin type III domain-containing protein [Idiomarina sp. M1R2S28]|uniref:Fibronectin type III domain-containing protein n=1 Tax=Idiomarina rhizosphaerae TaxID=2961572 RepID=A0A9X2FT51_9GAMM|nr:fibronectin type III domain-containing protein [Idiomarina rhizosphaerae]MCP1338636.1 fibronectin type III domain-containing protein [Idiomarina rhizosphaerae]